MSYYLWKAIIGKTPKLPIEKAEYDSLRIAWAAIALVVAIEEEWDNLIQNYVELEMELLRSAMNSMVLSHESYHEMNQLRLGFARRLSNLLQSCKSYLDHTPHHLGALPVVGLPAAFTKLIKEAYDGHISYRFMEALRNYAQHRGLPLHGASFDSEWTGDFSDDDKNKGGLRHSVGASIDLMRIKADGKFKASVIKELAEDIDQLDVAILSREYIEALAAVHDGLRSLLKEPLKGWSDAIRGAIARYKEANAGDALGLSVAEFNDATGLAVTYQNIFEDLPDRVDRLMRRNRNLVNLRLRYVTSETAPKRSARLMPRVKGEA